jgi:hypothetical protein
MTQLTDADKKIEDGKPCSHSGCLSHISHPCEGCGRIGGRRVNLTDDEKKLLTELLGERWHDIELSFHDGMVSTCSCGAGGVKARMECPKNNRTFTTWQDLGDLKNKLAEKGLWQEFYQLCARNYKATRMVNWKWIDESSVSSWLINPGVFIPLVAEFLKRPT